jgi:hypothetical protein
MSSNPLLLLESRFLAAAPRVQILGSYWIVEFSLQHSKFLKTSHDQPSRLSSLPNMFPINNLLLKRQQHVQWPLVLKAGQGQFCRISKALR